jgi:uncharacterized protein (DUF1810 family)
MTEYNLERFVDAQAGVFDIALAEVRRGRKASHWMWFIFPQMGGLGSSPTSQFYGIGSLDEARAYLAHPVLGQRLRQIAEALQDLVGTTSEEVFGTVDALKLRSSLTLFAVADGDGGILGAALERWFQGQQDERTLELLGRREG